MENNKTVHLTQINQVPVFKLDSYTIELNRCFGATFIPDQKCWVFPAYFPYGLYVVDDFNIVDEDITFTDEAISHINQLQLIPKLIEEQRFDGSFSFYVQPYAHQLYSFVHSYYNPRSSLLLDPGLGKSGVVINLVRYLKFLGDENHKTLLIVPKVILKKWYREIKFHAKDDLSVVIVDGSLPKKRKQLQTEADIHVMTYGSAAGVKAYTKKEETNGSALISMADLIVNTLDYGIMVVDESHNLLSPTSNKTKTCLKLSKKAARRIIMTGTASLGNPMHLYGQLKFLGEYNAESYWHYRNKFLTFFDEKRRMVAGYRSLDILQRRLSRTSVVYKAEDCLDLPPLNIIDTSFTLSNQQKKDYNDLIMSTAAELEKKINITEVATATARITKLLQITSGFMYQSNKNPKICEGCPHQYNCESVGIKPYTSRCLVSRTPPPVTTFRYQDNPKRDMLEELLNSITVSDTNKVVIWARYTEELNLIQELAENMSLGFVRVDGSKTIKEVDDNIEKFSHDEDCRIYLGQIATGIGIDLVSANYTIYYSLDYDLGHYEQSLYRNHRIGQSRPVTVYRLLAEHSIEEFIAASLSLKKNIASALTSHIHCAICKENERCLRDDVAPFDKDCIYQSRTEKIVTRPRVIDDSKMW
jgi:SNF2 family DNA or RNA helicase